jgi:hypothetical protein
MVRVARVWCDGGGGGCSNGKGGREGGEGGGCKGVGWVRGAATRVREDRGASRPSDANQRPKTHSLNRAPGPNERMPKKIYCFSEVSVS